MRWNTLQRASLVISLLFLAAWSAAVCSAEGPKVVGGVASAANPEEKEVDKPAPAAAKKTDAKDEKKDDKSDDKKDDEEETTPEELAKRLEFDWNQITASATRNLKQPTTTRSINIYGQVKIVNEQDILALGQQTELTSAVDDTGKDLAPAALAQPQGAVNPLNKLAIAVGRRVVNPFGPQRYYQFPNRQPQQAPWFGAIMPIGTNININLNQNTVPKKLASVKGTLMVLVGKIMPPVDMAASASDDWTELGHDLSIRLAKADQQNGSIQYQLESKGDEAVKQFHGWVGPQQALPKTIITKVAFVDEFNQVHEIHTGSAFNPNTSGSAGFGNVGRIAIMRFTYATDVHEVAVPFEIKDLEVPTFGSAAKELKSP